MSVIAQVRFADGSVRLLDDMTTAERNRVARMLNLQAAKALAEHWGVKVVEFDEVGGGTKGGVR